MPMSITAHEWRMNIWAEADSRLDPCNTVGGRVGGMGWTCASWSAYHTKPNRQASKGAQQEC